MNRPTVLYSGASRGVAFAAYLSLAAQRPDLHHVLFLRSPSRFRQSEEYKSLPDDVVQRSTYFQGDAHSAEDVRSVLRITGQAIVGIVSSIGSKPPSSLIGFMSIVVYGIDPPDLCTRALAILLTELSRVYPTLTTKTKFVLCSSMGTGEVPHKALAFGLGLLFSLALHGPSADKVGMGYVMARSTLPPDLNVAEESSLPRFGPGESEVLPQVLSRDAQAALPPPFLLASDVCIIRSALLTDGPSLGMSKTVRTPLDGLKKNAQGDNGYRVTQDGLADHESKGKSMYSISRKDAGHFVAEILGGKNRDAQLWWGRQPVLAY